MNFVRQLIRHIGSCITAEKGKRIFYAFVNIVFIAIAVFSGWGVLKAWEIMFSETFIGGLLLLIVCATFAILSLIDGVIGQLIHTVVNFIFIFNREDVIGQLIHTVVNFIFIFNREERGYAICAFIIALLSIIAMVVVMVILLN